MREPGFLVLSALVTEPRHGYALMREIEHGSRGRVQLRTSSLYALLDKLAADGLIEDAGRQVVNGRLRRLFSLTDHGRELLTSEAARMVAQAKEATRRLQITST
ncbi:MAG: PadR family transcriptional regulator [Actinomycetota bacterium]|nr:PadR family transcriptional regulator [Actinomycetota bacterium]